MQKSKKDTATARTVMKKIKEHTLSDTDRVFIATAREILANEKVQQMVIDEMITTGHARALISVEDKEMQVQLANQIFDNKLSVRETEKLIRKILQNKENTPKEEKENTLNYIYEHIAEQMKQIFGTKVQIHQKDKNKGKIEIEYYSQDELNRLLEMMQSIKTNQKHMFETGGINIV